MLQSIVVVISFVMIISTLTLATVAEAQEQTQPPLSDGNSSSSAQMLSQSLEDLIRPYIGYITFAIDVSAGIIIGISAIMALISFLKILRKSVEQQTQDKETIRLRLARGMLLALDFEVGSDILKTILVPSITELTILAVVVGIRIVLSWSLSKEIDRHADIKAGRRRSEVAFQTTSSETSTKKEDENNNVASEASTAEPNGGRIKQRDRDTSSRPPTSSSISEG